MRIAARHALPAHDRSHRGIRWRQCPDPVANPLDAPVIDRHRRDACSEPGAEVPLVHRIVVAVPVQLQPFARLLIPERRKVRGADQLRRRQAVERPVELDGLVGVEGVDASPSPPRHSVSENRLDAVAQLQRLHLQAVDQPEAQQRALKEGRSARVRQSAAYGIRRHAVVEGTCHARTRRTTEGRAGAPACRARFWEARPACHEPSLYGRRRSSGRHDRRPGGCVVPRRLAARVLARR